MDNQDKNIGEKPYIKEKIVKKKRSVRKFLLQVFLFTILAVIFGVVAAATFYVIKPWAENKEPVETTQSRIDFPVYTQAPTTEKTTEAEAETTVFIETTTESTESLETATESDTESVFSNEQSGWIKNEVSSQVSAQITGQTLGIDDVKKEDDIYASVVRVVSDSLVTLRGYIGDTVAWQAQTMIIYRRDDSGEFLLLGDLNEYQKADRMTAEFSIASGRECAATFKGSDSIYNLVVFSVSTNNFSAKELNSIKVITLGNNFTMVVPNTILLIGEPYGIPSTAVSRISYVESEHYELDSSFRMFGTDIILPEGANGFAVNLSGELIGLINRTEDAPKGYATLIGTGRISDALSCICSGNNAALLGVYGQTVTQALQEQGMPVGVYVSSVKDGGPAYDAGICAGDIITSISQASITDVSWLAKVLTSNHLPGESVKVTLSRESHGEYKSITVSVILGSR